MAYEKQTWQTGDIITALKLNHMEDGIESAPGYHVETQNVTIIPQQSVTTVDDEGSNYGSITLTNMEGLTEPPVSLQVVFNGVNYNCPKIEGPMPSYGAQWDDSLNDGEGGMDWSEYPFLIALLTPESGVINTESAGTYTVSADMVGAQLVIDPEFEEAVNTVVGDSGGSSESELPDYSGKGRYTLVTDARGEHISWSNLEYTDSGSAGLYTNQRNYYTKNAVIHVHGSISQIKQNIAVGWFGGMKQYTTATLALYSTNGLELVYQIDPTNNPTLIYDKGTESPSNVTVQGDVVIVTNS